MSGNAPVLNNDLISKNVNIRDMMKLLCKICAVSVLGCSLGSGYEIVISTYYKDGRDDSKQVIFDPNTALMWQDDESAKSVGEEWQGAIEYCQNLNLAGYSDWRLPSQDREQYHNLHLLPQLAPINQTKPIEGAIILYSKIDFYLHFDDFYTILK